jgi:hypothetical protein
MFQGGRILLRTHKTRPVGGALVLVITLVVSLCVGAAGMSAQADDTSPTSGTDPSASASPAGGATSTSDQGLARQLLGPAPAV